MALNSASYSCLQFPPCISSSSDVQRLPPNTEIRCFYRCFCANEIRSTPLIASHQMGVGVTGHRQRVLPPKMLTNAVISGARPREKPFKLSDGGGLFLLVNPSGSRWWRFKFRVHGRENLLSLGIFPEVPLREARELRDDARRDLRKGIDPAAKRRTARMAGGETCKAIAQEWFR
jgi:hypothetical protein